MPRNKIQYSKLLVLLSNFNNENRWAKSLHHFHDYSLCLCLYRVRHGWIYLTVKSTPTSMVWSKKLLVGLVLKICACLIYIFGVSVRLDGSGILVSFSNLIPELTNKQILWIGFYLNWTDYPIQFENLLLGWIELVG